MPPANPCSSRSRSKIRFGRMVLLPRPGFVIGQNASMTPMNGSSFGRTGGLLRVTRRHRETHHLGDCSRIDPEAPRRRPLAQPLDPHRPPDLRIKIHPLHPPPPADAGTGTGTGLQLPDFTPAQPTDSAASLRDFLSGAYRRLRRVDLLPLRWLSRPRMSALPAMRRRRNSRWAKLAAREPHARGHSNQACD